ncbi:hypothetical protein NPIL_506711 [Nephila pilipes]|uniref:Uncharacterized protein n=1 Tax=Nephila pilipes TaxID=299642 RepID=A0A8X6QB10_NEPPI|nr:hypothetical protein NPIL_506711 [Nephila pilipes]
MGHFAAHINSVKKEEGVAGKMDSVNFIAHNPGRKGKLKEMRGKNFLPGVFMRGIECWLRIIDPCDSMLYDGCKKNPKSQTCVRKSLGSDREEGEEKE